MWEMQAGEKKKKKQADFCAESARAIEMLLWGERMRSRKSFENFLAQCIEILVRFII